MSAVVLIVDGPGKGQLWTVPTDVHGNPPAVIEGVVTSGREMPTVATYDREVNPGDDGTLWQYRYRAPKAAP